MTASYVMAVDQGTTATKTMLIDRRDSASTLSNQILEQIYPKPGWVEMSPEAIWDSIITTASQTLEDSGAKSKDISALGLSNQGETIIAWDKNSGAPLYNAITWQCTRTDQLCETIKSRINENDVRSKTGLIVDPYLSASKIQWLLENVSEVKSAFNNGSLMIGNLDSWMMWKLSGGKIFATDYSTASRTLLFNVHTLDWDDHLLELFDVPRWVLPEPKPCSHKYGLTDPDIFLGLEIPITASAVDQPAALFGQTCFNQGDLKVTYGTGAFMLMNMGSEFVASNHGLLSSIAATAVDEAVQYYFDGGIYSVGAAVQWMMQNLNLAGDVKEISSLAESLSDSEGVVFVPALVGLAAPHWERNVQASFMGLTRGSTKAHMVRAVLEAIAYRVCEVVRVMEEDSGSRIEEIKVDGGVSNNDFLMQFQADLLGIPLIKSKSAEITGLGVAHLAGLEAGFWKDKNEFYKTLEVDRKYEPAGNNENLQASYEHWQKAVDAAKTFSRP